MLQTPWIAAVLGFALGFGMIALVAVSRTLVRSHGGQTQTVAMAAAAGLTMIIIMGALLGYALSVPETFLWFGLATAAGFLIGLVVMAVWMVNAVKQEERRG